MASLIRAFGDVDVAEDAVQDAFVVALERWPQDGLPDEPAAWITAVGRRRGIDGLRRQSLGRSLVADLAEAAPLEAEGAAPDAFPMDDDQLRLIHMCCHPALAPEAQVALTLRLLCGLDTAEIARAFLVPETTLAQRIVRAKRKIKAAAVPFKVPAPEDLDERLAAVLATIYLVHNAGVSRPLGEGGRVTDLCDEAQRLARLMVSLYPREPEVRALLALLLFGEARRPARFDAEGQIVRLGDQDRGRWRRDFLDEAFALLEGCAAGAPRRLYRLQAELQAVHCRADSTESTVWRRIVTLYDELLALTRSPVVALNRAIALAEVEGPGAGLTALEGLDEQLHGYHLLAATRGEFLWRLGRGEEAAASFEQAAAAARSDEEIHLLRARAAECRRA